MNKLDTYLRLYHYCVETYLLYIFLFGFYLFSNILPPIGSFLVLLVIGGGMVFTIFLKLKRQSKLTFILAAVLIVLIGFILNVPYGQLLLIAGFMLWRIPTLVNEADRENEAKVIGVVFCLGVSYYIVASLTEYPYKNVILLLVAVYVMLLVVGRFLKTVMASTLANADVRKKQINWLAKMVSIALGGIAILTFALPVIKWSFFFLLKSIFIVLSIPFMPILYWLLSLESLQNAFNVDTQNPQGEEDPALQELMESMKNREIADLSTLWAFLTVLIAAIGFYLIWKKYKNYEKREDKIDESLIIRTKATDLINPGQTMYKGKKKPPKDIVRRLFFELEKIGAKKKIGRKTSETAEQWFERLHFKEYEDVLKDYQKVRYAEVSLNKEEQENYAQVMKELKHKIIQLDKDGKQEDV
jgi:hypothetical protein